MILFVPIDSVLAVPEEWLHHNWPHHTPSTHLSLSCKVVVTLIPVQLTISPWFLVRYQFDIALVIVFPGDRAAADLPSCSQSKRREILRSLWLSVISVKAQAPS